VLLAWQQGAPLHGMKVLQSFGSLASFARIWSFFLSSFKKNATFASGSTHLMMSPHSFLVSNSALNSYVASAVCAYSNAFN
jgi:hypothetical protein